MEEDDFSNDYSYPSAIASKFEEIEDRLNEIERKRSNSDHGSAGGIGFYGFGAALAMILSWSRDVNILYCIGHGILSWIYVIYFAFTR
jgi:tetrahydromethanopterin S-methyltransferase subunit G